MIENIKYQKISTTDEIHFSGGLRGLICFRELKIHPIKNSNYPGGNQQKINHNMLLDGEDIIMLGINEHVKMPGTSVENNIWHPSQKNKILSETSSDLWGSIAYQAEKSGDSDYSDCARYISISLRMAGLRLRDISNHYHDQLNWAISDKTPSGKWFTNIAALDIYADYHSFVSELSSARDYIAKIAGITVGAPDNIDSLARLESWLDKKINHHALSDPIVASLIKASGTVSTPGWLRELGKIRNEMLHKMPMGANNAVSCLILNNIQTVLGEIQIIQLTDRTASSERNNKNTDPLNQLVQISQSLEDLSMGIIPHTKYPTTPPNYS